MNDSARPVLRGSVVEDDLTLGIDELCRACRASEVQIREWVFEGVIEPIDSGGEWRFSGRMLARTRLALRLTQDLEVNPAGAALALDLLDEIAVLRARLRRLGFE